MLGSWVRIPAGSQENEKYQKFSSVFKVKAS
jgi:hypothetical protein